MPYHFNVNIPNYKKTEDINIFQFTCKKEYIIRQMDSDTDLNPNNIDAAFRVNNVYNAKKSKNPLYLYEFNFGYLTYMMNDDNIKRIFYTQSEVRKMKLNKLNGEI